MIHFDPNSSAAPEAPAPILLSIGIMARNEAGSIHHTIASLFAQTVFHEISAHGGRLEIICVINGSSDRTAEVVDELFAEASRNHPQREHFEARTEVLAASGKPNACNQFIHGCSAKEARALVLMDADITFVDSSAIWNLFSGLEQNAGAYVSVGQPIKNLSPDHTSRLRGKLSRATTRMTQSAPAQLTGQLYCIRTAIARQIHFPRALTACDDGYVKNLVCTNVGRTPLQNDRILPVANAAHKFDPYLPLKHVIMNQKRQVMGQAYLHILIDQFIPGLEPAERKDLGRVIQQLEETRPPWLTELMAQHLHETRFFWRLFPGLLSFRFQRLKSFPLSKRVGLFPASLAGFGVTLLAAWLAARALRKGDSQYWPELRGMAKCSGPESTLLG